MWGFHKSGYILHVVREIPVLHAVNLMKYNLVINDAAHSVIHSAQNIDGFFQILMGKTSQMYCSINNNLINACFE